MKKKNRRTSTARKKSVSHHTKHKHLPKLLALFGLTCLAFAFIIVGSSHNTSASTIVCTQTGFFRDGINMTAAKINPGKVTGEIDATGCNVGVYYDSNGSVDKANIHGANYFGVLVNGDVKNPSVDVTNSNIHDIGETPLNGTQHGVGIYYRAFGAGTTTGKIWNNTISNYQKGGIVTNGAGTTADIKGNFVAGQGPVNYIAQNGIQVGYGATAQVMKNTVTGNSYTGPNFASSGGIIAVGGAGYGICPDGNPCPYTTKTIIDSNIVNGNDVGIWLSNIDDSFNPPATQTNIKVVNNTLNNTGLNNTTGLSATQGYQAGIADQGNNDKIINNNISGVGYSPTNSSATLFITDIDASPAFTNRAKIHANNSN